MLPEITWIDIFLCILLLAIGVYGVNYFKRKYKIDSPFFLLLFYAKILGLIAFILFNFFHENSGDTFVFYKGGGMLFNKFIESPSAYFKLIFSDSQNMIENLKGVCGTCGFRGDNSSIFMMKITSIFNVVTFNSFWLSSMLFCYVAFVGTWLMYMGFEKVFNPLSNLTTIFILFIPSVLFWTSGIMKDTLCFSALGVLFYFLSIEISFKKITNCLLIGLSVLILFWLKVYILICLGLAYFIYLLILIIKKRAYLIHNVLFVSAVLFVLIVVGFEFLNDFKLWNHTLIRLKDFHTYHALNSDYGYNLGEMNYGFFNLLLKSPQAIFTALYRPFFWEASNILMWIPTIESFLFLIIGVYIILTLRIKIFQLLKNNLALIFCFLFVLFLAYVVGLSSYSFGALSRYRVPFIPFYIGGIFFIRSSRD
jgi:hypothetical protein